MKLEARSWVARKGEDEEHPTVGLDRATRLEESGDWVVL